MIRNNGCGIGRSGCSTQAEYDAKPEVDLIGNLANAKVRDAVSVINSFVSQYVCDLKWDFLSIGQGSEFSEPYDTAGAPQDIIEGTCGITCLGAATDCQGFVNRMQYQQQLDKEVMFFGCVDVSNPKGIYEIECSEGLILLGNTIPSLPYSHNGNAALEELGFRIAGEQRFTFPTQVSPAFPATKDHEVKENGRNNRVIIEGCTNPDSLMFRLTPSSEGCTVIPIDRNIDW